MATLLRDASTYILYEFFGVKYIYYDGAGAVVAFWGKNQAAGSGFVNKPFNGFQSRKNLWGYFLL